MMVKVQRPLILLFITISSFTIHCHAIEGPLQHRCYHELVNKCDIIHVNFSYLNHIFCMELKLLMSWYRDICDHLYYLLGSKHLLLQCPESMLQQKTTSDGILWKYAAITKKASNIYVVHWRLEFLHWVVSKFVLTNAEVNCSHP